MMLKPQWQYVMQIIFFMFWQKYTSDLMPAGLSVVFKKI